MAASRVSPQTTKSRRQSLKTCCVLIKQLGIGEAQVKEKKSVFYGGFCHVNFPVAAHRDLPWLKGAMTKRFLLTQTRPGTCAIRSA